MSGKFQYIAAAVFATYLGFSWWLNREPSADSLMVVSVFVPNLSIGSDPEVVYGREIFEEFKATWLVKVLGFENDVVVCQGSGIYIYEPDDRVSGMSLSEYIGADCQLSAGRYYMRTSWVPIKGETIKNISNVFTVYE